MKVVHGSVILNSCFMTECLKDTSSVGPDFQSVITQGLFLSMVGFFSYAVIFYYISNKDISAK